MKWIEESDIRSMKQRYRGRFVNSLSGFKSANLVGTKSKTGHENLSIVSSCFHLGSNPALLGMIKRPPSVPRHTYENILETSYYTLNHVHTAIIKQAHQTSARFERDVSEFEAVDLRAGYRSGFYAPFVEESPVSIGLKLLEDVHIKHNDTRLIIGSIQWVRVNDGLIADDGYINLEAAGITTLSGLDSYHQTERLFRLTYAKPGKDVEELGDIMGGFAD